MSMVNDSVFTERMAAMIAKGEFDKFIKSYASEARKKPENLKLDYFPMMRFITTRDIKRGEVLEWLYSHNYWIVQSLRKNNKTVKIPKIAQSN